MTEADWLQCQAPQKMLEFLRGKVSDRKLRLFAVACCFSIHHLLTDPKSLKAVQTVSRVADAESDLLELEEAFQQAYSAHDESDAATLSALAAEVVAHAVQEHAWDAASNACDASAHTRCYEQEFPEPPVDMSKGVNFDLLIEVQKHRAQTLRCIFNPFHPVTLSQACLTATVTALAHDIYTSRSFERLPILADALEEGGCSSLELLQHMRSEGPHARGCWALDLILGKE